MPGTAIRAALAAAIDSVGSAADQVANMSRLRALAEAGRILLADPRRLAEAIRLTRTAAPELADTAPLAHIRLIALFRSGDQKATVAEADRVLQAGSLDPAGRKIIFNSLRQWGLDRALPPRADYLHDYWEDVDAAIADPFSGVKPGPSALLDRIGPAIARLSGRDPDDAAFLDRVKWGTEVFHRRRHIQRSVRNVLDKPAAQRTAAEGKLLELQQAINARITGIDLDLVAAQIDAGRSVLIAQAHAGLSVVHHIGLQQPLPFPYSVVADGAGSASRPQDFHLSPLSPNAAMDFAKLAKLMRKFPRVVRIYPDGPSGEQTTVSVFGRPVKIGRGAATLAYLGKAATYFATSHWTGSGFAFSLQPGPVASDYADLETFEHAFGAFYGKCIEQIVLGPPEDMAPEAGFWPYLLK